MAIQKVWLHDQECKCKRCQLQNDKQTLVFLDNCDKEHSVTISYEMCTFIKDQHGQRYIITPIPDME